MTKELKSQQSASHGGCCYLENLPDELVILIFTKLSSSRGHGRREGNLDDIKLLVQCSIVCKRFNSLTCLVSTLCIVHPSIMTLYEWCPVILEKFKHIRLLQVLHCSYTDLHMDSEHDDLPTIRWEAAYRPHSYCLAVVLFRKLSCYVGKQVEQPVILSDVAFEIHQDLYKSLWEYTIHLILHHHMLVSSIKDHKYLQRVVVSDYSNRGTFTLDEDLLVKLRNCCSTNLEQVQARLRSGIPINLDFSLGNNSNRVVLNAICFHIIEWREKASSDAFFREDGDVDREIPGNLPFQGSLGRLLKNYLQILLKYTTYLQDNNHKIVPQLLLDIKSLGDLL